MKQEKVIKICVAILCIAIIICVYTYQNYSEFPNYCEKGLEKVQYKIDNQLSFSKFDNYDKEVLFDNLCGLKNITGICYFNTLMQLLFSNRYFQYFLIKNRFEKDSVSKIMQKMCYKMITKKYVDLTDEMFLLKKKENMKNHIKFHTGGYPQDTITALMGYLVDENTGNDEDGSPTSFINTLTTNYVCMCGETTVKKKKFIFLEYNIDGKKIEVEDLNTIKCTQCNKNIYTKIHKQYEYAKNLLLKIDYTKYALSEILTNYSKKIESTFDIEGEKYYLTATSCITVKYNTLHATTYVKKGPKWYSIDDGNIEPVSLDEKQTIKFYWLFSYRKMKKGC